MPPRIISSLAVVLKSHITPSLYQPSNLQPLFAGSGTGLATGSPTVTSWDCGAGLPPMASNATVTLYLSHFA